MSHSVFKSLHHAWSRPGYVLHDVRLQDVQPGGGGGGMHLLERLTVECQGETATLQGGGRWDPEHSRRHVGRVGSLAPSMVHSPGEPTYTFQPYLDPTLRRAPELDGPDRYAQPGQAHNVVGWRCDAQPAGFCAPVGLIPGDDGAFVRDDTVAVTLRVPPEFLQLAGQYQHTPESLLRAFVADVCGLTNLVANPRADHYSSNGSDERDLAVQWLERAFAQNRAEQEALDAQQELLDEATLRRDEENDALLDLLDEYRDEDGDPRELIACVRAFVKGVA